MQRQSKQQSPLLKLVSALAQKKNKAKITKLRCYQATCLSGYYKLFTQNFMNFFLNLQKKKKKKKKRRKDTF